MPEILIRNFKQGLDTRREVLSSLPGTLQNLVNAHINQGGEIEKRYAFVRTALPPNTFGLESTAAGLITFGSDPDPGGWPRGAVTGYQRLQHPAVLDGAVYDAQYHAMTDVAWSYSFLGRAWVAATFADGRTFLYYDGDLVEHSRNGLVLPGWTTQDDINKSIVNNWAANVNTIPGWKTTGPVYNFPTPGLTNSFSFQFWSPDSIAFDLVASYVSANGILSFNKIGPAAGVTAVPGTTTLTINGSAGSSYSLAVKLSLGAASQTTIVDTVNWTTSNDNTAAKITTAINRGTEYHGFSASREGAVITITNPTLTVYDVDYGDGVVTGVYTWPDLTVTAVNDAGANGNKAFSVSIASRPAAGGTAIGTIYHAWAVGDSWTVNVVDSGGSEYTLGKGNIAGISFDFGFVHKQRGYIANGTQFNFSSINDVTLWEQQNLGAGFVVFQSQFGQEDKVQAFADYQGRLAVFGRRTVQIWQTDADPTQFALVQTLTNYGTVAPYSVHSLGELETFFLSDSGIRSLRARQTTLNAFVEDLGSPIDSIIQGVLNGLTDEEKAQAVGVIEPTRGSYWLYLDDTLYVLSLFPSAKIVAWSKYEMTYNNGTPCRVVNNTGVTRSYFVGVENDPTKATQTFSLADGASQSIWFPAKYIWSAVGAADPVLATTLADGFVGEIVHTAEAAVTTTSAHTSFVPKKFLIHRGQVFARDADAVYAYGGSDKVTFDTSIVTVELPWLDHDKPTTLKSFSEIDVGISGKWLVEAGVDPYSGEMEVTLVDGDAATPTTAKDSSFDKQTISFNANGSHMKFKARSTSNNVGLAKLSTLVARYM